MCSGFRVFVFSWLIICALPGRSPAQTQPIWFGVWTLNLAKSTSSSPLPFKRATRRIEPTGDSVTIIDDQVRRRGGITHLEWTGKFDAADYSVQGVELLLTHAYRRLDERTLVLTQKIDNVVVSTARFTLSPDVNSITMVTSGATSTTTVYDKR